jgi:hypothetical protein
MPCTHIGGETGPALLNIAARAAIHGLDMRISPNILGRKLRLVLLLLVLAAQGIANAHELGSSHALDSHPCSVCLVGHGLGAAVNAHPDVPQLQVDQALVTSRSIDNVRSSHNSYYSTRAPPQSLR